MLILVTPTSIKQSIEDARTADDKYGYRQRLREATVDELIAAYNREVGIQAWGSARQAFLIALRDALLASGLDCSGFISTTGMSMASKIERRGDAIVAR